MGLNIGTPLPRSRDSYPHYSANQWKTDAVYWEMLDIKPHLIATPCLPVLSTIDDLLACSLIAWHGAGEWTRLKILHDLNNI
ncbi:hypothetical protein AVEN_228953-1 [Araneus ventricosus]|uniref:Uncharacterized protein n=1 Tax=Araneus ventricosus TaxID=182803 RepID=A0A4Y2K7G4_ARAVE|nr:hypothetical protein AVEN_228953-1 [Araneus ventricosus]